ncbi:MAG: Mannosylglycerate hydrolase [bacterium ADurb.Bin429]|nr:MAG: Mannosylglycerate hydrolase [bacterium ADurb.Bin429]
MEKHPQVTLERIGRVVEELSRSLWMDRRPLRVAVYQCAEPIPYEDAVQQAYQPVELGYPWGPAWSTAWFHLEGEVPAEWAGRTVAALIDTGSEALLWADGAPAQGLDENRRDFTLDCPFVDLYVEAAGNFPFGFGHGNANPTPFALKQAEVAWLNRPAWDLYHDLRVLHGLIEQLPENSPRRAKLLYTVNEAVNAYYRGGDAKYENARAILTAAFADPACASASDVTALGHSHIDTAWLWPLRETVRKCSRTFATVLRYMETYPEYRYVQSQPQLYAFMKERFPALYARIKQAVAEGRWEPEGGMWVEADCNVPSGEALVRQFLYGMQFFREEFGIECSILWLPDVFGYSAALPQILQGCGIRYFLTQKLSWNQFNPIPHHTFWWEGIDGSRVLAHFPPADTYNGVVTPKEILHGERNFRDKDRSDTWLYLFGFGDGGGGVTKEMLEAARRMRDVEGLPRVAQGFAHEWFPRMEAEARDLRTWVGELYFERHRGTYTTQAKNKWENRRCELLLRDAEFLAALHPAGAAAYPAEVLARAWKLVLLNQFHDILPGSSIGWVYEDSQRQYAEVHEAGDAIIADATSAFAQQIHTDGMTHPVLIWNTLSFARSGMVSIPWKGSAKVVAQAPKGELYRTQLSEEDGQRRLLVEVTDAPSMGYTVYDIRRGRFAEDIGDVATATPTALENGLVRVTLDARGGVTSFFDKQAEREIIAPGMAGNLFKLLNDHPTNWDAWEIDPFAEEVTTDLLGEATITVTENGPLRASVKVERALTPRATLTQYIRLETNSRRLDFETIIDWREEHALLKVAFPVAVHSVRATYEIQYGHVERPTHRNTSWDIARFEVPAHKWADLSESDYGVALLNDGKYGYDVQGSVLRLTLLRAPKSPDPDADMGVHRFTYSLLPHRGDVVNSGVPLAGYDLNVPLRVSPLPVREGVLAQAHSYFRLDKHNLLIESVKRAEDGDGLIVRLYEAYRRRGVARLITNGLCSRVTRTDLLERDQEELPVQGGAVELPFRPFEIITLRLR